ncbi:MAG: hypothetical protein JWQ30_636 [Sediminibacterium sp.]|nr:hypothetical protein [Sediminibacterium sp.]
MKNIFVALLLLSSASFAQNRDRNDQPPTNIRRSFERNNANSKNTQWTKSSSNWHANYRDNNNRSVDSYYDRRGNLMATHREINRNEIPRRVDTRITNLYHPQGNYSVRKIERPNTPSLFQIILQLATGGSRTVYMDEQGRQRDYHSPY